MLAEQRQMRLEEIIQKTGCIQVSRLSSLLGVSEMTVRRDLDALAKLGKVNRVHGGAVAVDTLQFGSRLQVNSKPKRQLIRKVAHAVPPVGCIYLDGSTTIFGLCDFIGDARDLQIVTNNLQTFQRLCAIKGVKPMILGGSLDSRTDNLVGPMARRALQHMHFDQAYMSCFALDADLGCMEATLEDAEIKEIVGRQCSRIYIAIDRSKLGGTATGSWAHSGEKSILVTDLDAADEKLDPFREGFHNVL